MATTDLGACEWFVWNLQRSNLIDRGQLDQVVGEFLKKQPRAEPSALAQYLVTEGILSQFQAERLIPLQLKRLQACRPKDGSDPMRIVYTIVIHGPAAKDYVDARADLLGKNIQKTQPG